MIKTQDLRWFRFMRMEDHLFPLYFLISPCCESSSALPPLAKRPPDDGTIHAQSPIPMGPDLFAEEDGASTL